MSNKLLHTELAARYKHHMQVKMKYYHLGKEKINLSCIFLTKEDKFLVFHI
jgi:hypothetical protein